MWLLVTALCGLQLWVILGLVPALAGGTVAWVWTGLAAAALACGTALLRRYPDGGTVILGVVLPVTLVPPFVTGRSATPLATAVPVQILLGVTLAAYLVALARARRAELRPLLAAALRPAEAARPASFGGARRLLATALGLAAALWLALPLRALLDPTLMDGPLASTDPVRAKVILLLVAWPSATVVALGAILPALASAAGSLPTRRSTAALLAGGLAAAAVWGGLIALGA